MTRSSPWREPVAWMIAFAFGLLTAIAMREGDWSRAVGWACIGGALLLNRGGRRPLRHPRTLTAWGLMLVALVLLVARWVERVG